MPAAATETASLGLSGGGDNSYGYGDSGRRSGGAVIDLRRPSSPQHPAPARVERPAPVPPPQVGAEAREEGTVAWLERERVGPPYEANGRWYVPTPEPGYAQTGTASWYGPQFHGQQTANGEVYDQEAMTAAHPTLPLNSLVQVTNLENGREVIVRVNDRGPFVGARLIDLSHGAAVALGFERQGQARVHVRYLGPAPRRVAADGAPASSPLPRATEEGPASLLPPAVETPAPAPSPPVLAAGGYFVQVGAFSDQANAQRVSNVVSAAGPVVMDVRQTARGDLHRVRVGPWESREEAEGARQVLASLGYGESVVAAR
jgi:rare lipoprotein A